MYKAGQDRTWRYDCVLQNTAASTNLPRYSRSTPTLSNTDTRISFGLTSDGFDNFSSSVFVDSYPPRMNPSRNIWTSWPLALMNMRNWNRQQHIWYPGWYRSRYSWISPSVEHRKGSGSQAGVTFLCVWYLYLSWHLEHSTGIKKAWIVTRPTLVPIFCSSAFHPFTQVTP